MHEPLNQSFALSDDFIVGTDERLLLLAGPCQIESRDHALMCAEKLKEVCSDLPLFLVFKSSYDKANRTSVESARGVGIDEGLKILQEVRSEFALPVVTDVHSPEQALAAGEVVDIIQTPAFLCRQTDLLLAAGNTGKPVNVKKGQFLAPEDMKHAADKIASTGNQKILLCERGTCFGYRDLIVDPRSLIIMRELGRPIVFDATHSVQVMGGAGGSSTGNRQFVRPLVHAAVTLGADGLFIECHDNPDAAPSDGPNMMPLSEMSDLLKQACKLRETYLSL